MSTCVFIQIRCRPGTTYSVAEAQSFIPHRVILIC